MAGKRGGWRGAAASLAALNQHRPDTWGYVPCCRPWCSQPRVRGGPQCRKHGGASRIKNITPWRAAYRANCRMIAAAEREGRVPADLAASPWWPEIRHFATVHFGPMLLAAWASADPAERPRVIAAMERALGWR